MTMTMKKTIPAMALMLALMFAVSTAMAQPAASDDKRPPQKMNQMSPEDRAAWEVLWNEHRQKMAPLRDQMWAKNMEYDFLMANPNTKPAEVKAVIDEMMRLKGQLRAEHEKFAEAAKAKGLDRHGFGPGFHKGWRGHGLDGGFGDCPGFDRDRGPGRGGHGKMGSGHHHGGPMMDD